MMVSPSSVSAANKTISVLVTDDAKIIREMIKDVVKEIGWTVSGEAANGQDAVRLYNQLRPDIVTLDLVMPDFDGLYALQGIMSLDPKSRVLVVSALNQTNILQSAMAWGAKSAVTKPFKKEQLIAAMQKCLD